MFFCKYWIFENVTGRCYYNMQPSIDLRAGGQSIVIQPVLEDDDNDFYDIKILEPLSSAASGIGDWLQVHFCD